ncbi:LPS export ABC transporter permease LptF [Dongia rigui]|uniref:Lipopolysaccharide export system permease protein LptF n=1 Tax=Dongia rigui TaxID=940149 RepID=A0ABU5E5F1_9PROT|nr:LPS export ABC transporter permease LptF [Dongia rigui]MDY0874297.1 LPS export ABC transporter permease LptF [Dongia rigui]
MKFLRIDIYILKRVALPLLATVGIAMAALLLERLIRLLDLFANRGGPLNIVLKMLANLVPHYLGIAVPAALFVGVLYASMRLSSDSELDAMRASGLSLRRLLMPILALSVVLAIVSAYLIGFLQPYTRFAYRALVHLVVETAWDSAIERGAFFSGFGGKTILIGDISEGGSKLSQIFVKEVDENGQDLVTTAESGQLERNADLSLVLTLHNGVRTETTPGTNQSKAVVFTELELPMDTVAPEPFRNRGERESELDFFELIHAYFNTPTGLHIEDIKGELNSRLVRTLSIIFLPLLAMPIGVSSRRTSKGVRMLVGILFLVAYFQILQFGRDAVGSGITGSAIALWLPFVVFGCVSTWLFYLANSRPGADPLAHVFESISDGSGWIWNRVQRIMPRRSQGAAE